MFMAGTGVEVAFDVRKLLIEFYSNNIVHVEHVPDTSRRSKSCVVVVKPKDVEVLVNRINGCIAVSSKEMSVYVDAKNGVIEFRFGGLLVKEVSRKASKQNLYGDEFYTFEQVFEIEPGSGLYGLGQHARYSAHGVLICRNKMNKTIYLAQRNSDIAAPFLISHVGYGIL